MTASGDDTSHDHTSQDDGTSIVPIVIRSADTEARAAIASETAAAQQPARVGRPTFLTGSRIAVFGTLAVLVLALVGYGAFSFFDGRGERSAEAQAEREYNALLVASKAIQPLVSGYTLPASVDPRPACGRFSFRCGTSALEPRSAAASVAETFAPLGLGVGEAGCQDGIKAPNGDCWVALTYDGQSVGTVHAVRKDVPYRIFGAPTEVIVLMNEAGNSGTVVVPDPVTVPMSDAKVATSAFPRAVAQDLTCAKAGPAWGCLRYSVDHESTTGRNAAWTEIGRTFVRNGWQSIGGRCDPTTPKTDCNVDGTWVAPDGYEYHVAVKVSPIADGSRVRGDVRSLERISNP